jgi:hypothetical protein
MKENRCKRPRSQNDRKRSGLGILVVKSDVLCLWQPRLNFIKTITNPMAVKSTGKCELSFAQHSCNKLDYNGLRQMGASRV